MYERPDAGVRVWCGGTAVRCATGQCRGAARRKDRAKDPRVMLVTESISKSPILCLARREWNDGRRNRLRMASLTVSKSIEVNLNSRRKKGGILVDHFFRADDILIVNLAGTKLRYSSSVLANDSAMNRIGCKAQGTCFEPGRIALGGGVGES